MVIKPICLVKNRRDKDVYRRLSCYNPMQSGQRTGGKEGVLFHTLR